MMGAVVLILIGVGVLAMAVRIADVPRVVLFGLLVFLVIFVGPRLVSHVDPSSRTDPSRAAQAALGASEKARESTDDVAAAEQSVPASIEPSGTDDGAGPMIQIDPATAETTSPPKPEWIGSKPVRTGPVHTTAVSSEPQETEAEARRVLDEAIQRAVDEYVDEYFQTVYGSDFQASVYLAYDLNYIRAHLLRPENIYHEVVQLSFGPMHQMHALLEFDEAFRKELHERRREIERRRRDAMIIERVAGTALGLGFVLTLLAIAFGYFKLDTATHGHYRRRLRLAAAAAILALIATGILLAASGA